MPIRLYNTLSGQKEVFEPVQPGRVRMYVCGPTVYDYCHIGHARSVVVFDVIARYLRAAGFQVTYVRNFTDVDDKIINRAHELNVPPGELAEKFIQAFYQDMDALKVERADHEPRVTQYIDEIIAMIARLVEKGRAYPVDGDVYFSVESFAGYGKLSGRRLEDMAAGARVEVDPRKRNPFDFALWKSAKSGEPFWDSPWGRGRPGWHIECSAMSRELLGETFDIHGGGKDLIFPHHENEIAQSEGAWDRPFAHYWLHNGFVNINQEKMSKSLGNFLTIRDTLTQHHPEALRLFLLSSHYRSPLDYNDATLQEAAARLERFYTMAARVEQLLGPSDPADLQQRPYWPLFGAAMDDDFNTASGLAVLFEGVRRLNALMDEQGPTPSAEALAELRAGRADIVAIGRRVLGILTEPAAAYFDDMRRRRLAVQAVDPAKIQELIDQRTAARRSKDWATADRVRRRLDEMNIRIEDRPEGTIWRVK
jgi:cysteinyl-tRNA synthetase